MKTARVLFAAAIAASCSLVASGETFSSEIKLPGISRITTYNAVPEGFDPVSASDSALQDYGFPRRPELSDAKAYARWMQAVSTTRITPQLIVNSGVYHRPNQRISKPSLSAADNSQYYSGNWSGYSLVGGSPTFDEVVGLWVVPSVNNQFESFNGYMSEWVGIDGNCACDDLIQDGTEQQWSGGKPSYYAWIEFIPESELEIANFAVSPGDVIYAYSSVTEKSGVVYGNFYIANYSTRKSVSASLKIPPKTKFSGQSAEWIVERTEVNGSFSNPLPFYAQAYMDDAYAYRSGSNHAIDYASDSPENIIMLQGGTSLSKAYEQDGDSMWFQWLNYF